MSDKSVPTQPLTENEKLLSEKFYKSGVAQSSFADKLNERILLSRDFLRHVYRVRRRDE